MNDIITDMIQAEARVGSLEGQLSSKGLLIRRFRPDDSKTPTERLCLAREEVKFLEKLLDQVSATISIVPPVAVAPPVSAATSTSTPAPAQIAKLTSEEISRLNWTEQCNYAQGKLSDEEARTRLANRHSKKSGPTLTEQCMAVTGGKDQINRAE